MHLFWRLCTAAVALHYHISTVLASPYHLATTKSNADFPLAAADLSALSERALKTPLKVLCIGDSITIGVGDDSIGTGANNGYRLPLYNLLKKANVNVEFIGTQSSGTGNPQPHMEGYADQKINSILDNIKRNGIIRQQPNLVLIYAGSSDVGQLQADGKTPLDNALVRLGNLIDHVLCNDPQAVVLVAVLVQNKDHPKETVTFNAAIPAVIADRSKRGYKIQTVDMSSLGGNMLKDGQHPNTAGYQDMANRWYGAITNISDNWWSLSQAPKPSSASLLETCDRGPVASGSMIDGKTTAMVQSNGALHTSIPSSSTSPKILTTTNSAGQTVVQDPSGVPIVQYSSGNRATVQRSLPTVLTTTNSAGQTVVQASNGAQVTIPRSITTPITISASGNQVLTFNPSASGPVTSTNAAGQTILSGSFGAVTLRSGISVPTTITTDGRTFTYSPVKETTLTQLVGSTVITRSDVVLTLPKSITTPTTITSKGIVFTFQPELSTATTKTAGSVVTSKSGVGITLSSDSSVPTTITSNGVVITFSPIRRTTTVNSAANGVSSKSGAGITLPSDISVPTSITSNGVVITFSPIHRTTNVKSAGTDVTSKSGAGSGQSSPKSGEHNSLQSSKSGVSFKLPSDISVPTTVTSSGIAITIKPQSTTTTKSVGPTVITTSGVAITLPPGITQTITTTGPNGVRLTFRPSRPDTTTTSSSTTQPAGIYPYFRPPPPAPTQTDDSSVFSCKVWFFFICIDWIDIHIGGWTIKLPPGIRPPGPLPPINFPKGITVNIKGNPPDWPEITVGRDNIPTYSSKPDNCKTQSAEMCLTTTSFGVSGDKTTATQVLSTCATIYGCEATGKNSATTTTMTKSACTSQITTSNCQVSCRVVSTISQSSATTRCETVSCSTFSGCSVSSLAHSTTTTTVPACPLPPKYTPWWTAGTQLAPILGDGLHGGTVAHGTFNSHASLPTQTGKSSTAQKTSASVSQRSVASTSQHTNDFAWLHQPSDRAKLLSQALHCTQTQCDGKQVVVPKTGSSCAPQPTGCPTKATSSTSSEKKTSTTSAEKKTTTTTTSEKRTTTTTTSEKKTSTTSYPSYPTATDMHHAVQAYCYNPSNGPYVKFSSRDAEIVASGFCNRNYVLLPSEDYHADAGPSPDSPYDLFVAASWAKDQKGCWPKAAFHFNSNSRDCLNVWSHDYYCVDKHEDEAPTSYGGGYVLSTQRGCILFEMYAKSKGSKRRGSENISIGTAFNATGGVWNTTNLLHEHTAPLLYGTGHPEPPLFNDDLVNKLLDSATVDGFQVA
ncbi:hypothetical protein AMS68_000402 [Peltaster fructicola]|uniref:SGNH hydrolase-type esterase domain-containing protein n=1 Tax=Peltaster fructicola TaxID=286661 RepID=A0A6H0XJT6_9PEZI|nr:hypothetical protein AMS68_000402 [Peltaster fructicola]